uniref:DH domain-containing protein n=1 Tax=Anopheles culicifacies TaxID=139723 RepID=A0A182MG06_9DIPT
MHPKRPAIPPKPKLPGVTHSQDFRDSGISVSDDTTASSDSPKRTINTSDTVSTTHGGTPSAVRQLASHFETIALHRNSNLHRPNADLGEAESTPRKPSTTPLIQKLQTQVAGTLMGTPKPHSLPMLHSLHDRTNLSRRASAIAERIYDTVYERDRTEHNKSEPIETVQEELDDPTSTDGYSSFESSTDDEDEPHKRQSIKNNYYSITPDTNAPEYETTVPIDHIRKVIIELIEKEQKYIETLDHGIRNYVPAMYAQTLPAALRGLRNIIFINLEDILRTHRDHLLPDLERAANLSATCSGNSDRMAEKVAEVFLSYIENERFYCYVQFAMHHADSEFIRLRYNDYFLKIQHDLNDKLGLNSLLLQPIQRLPRYKLLLNEMVKDLLKDGDGHRTMSRRTALLCKVDKRLSILIDRVNQAINVHDIRQCSGSQTVTNSSLRHGSDIPLTLILQPEGNRNPERDTPINLLYQGKFQRLFLVDIYDSNVRRKYSGKLFAFEKLLLYAEILRDRLEYRGHFSDSELCYLEESRNRLVLYAGSRGSHEITVQSDTNTELQPLVALVYTMAKAVIYDTVGSGEPTPSHIMEDVDEDDHDLLPANDADDIWDEHKLTESFIEAQRQFLEVLIANRRFYLDTLSTEVKTKLTSFINAFEAIMELHRGILEDLAQPNPDPDKICHCFDRYLKTDVFDPYYDYLREFRKATKWIQHSQTPSNFNNRVASTVKQFTFLCIEHMQEYSRYFNVLIVKYSENSTLNIPIDTELFQRLAYVLVHLNTYRSNLAVNYELFLIDEHAPACGLVCHNERVTITNTPHAADAGPCRLFVCEKAAICVKVQDVHEHDQQVERFVRVLFFDRFQGRGAPMRMRKSKRQPQRLNFLIDGFKFRIDFDSTQALTTFYSNYVNRYIMI